MYYISDVNTYDKCVVRAVFILLMFLIIHYNNVIAGAPTRRQLFICYYHL